MLSFISPVLLNGHYLSDLPSPRLTVSRARAHPTPFLSDTGLNPGLGAHEASALPLNHALSPHQSPLGEHKLSMRIFIRAQSSVPPTSKEMCR